MLSALAVGLIGLTFATLTGQKPEGFLAEPKSGHGRGILVLHPWWGLNADTKAFCQRLADAGYVAYAPDLFHGKTATTEAGAEALVHAYEPKHEELEKQIADAAKFLSDKTGKKEIAVVGFSFGAYYALHLSNAEPALIKATVVFYGTGQQDFTKSKSTYLGHFAEHDDFEPKPAVDGLTKLLKEANRPATIHTYTGTGHWFFEPSVTKAYNKPAADLAWIRILEYLKNSLS